MDDRERYLAENVLVDAIADECAAIRARIAGEEARMLRRLADAWVLAQEQTSRIGSTASRKRDMPLRCIASQISVETRMNDRTVQTKMHDAFRMVTLFPATVTTLEGGRISKAHADVILDTGGALDDADVRAAFEGVVLEWAVSETVGRTRAYGRQLAEKLDPRAMSERHAEAADERSITIVDLDHGMSQIIALVPTAYAHAVVDRLTRQAKQIRTVDIAARREAAEAARDEAEREARTSAPGPTATAVSVSVVGASAGAKAGSGFGAGDGSSFAAGASFGAGSGFGSGADFAAGSGSGSGEDSAEATAGGFDERSLDQVRADLFVDLLLTGSPGIDPTVDQCPGGLGAIRAQVQITMSITTLTGLSQGGAEIDGKAPIDPATARILAGTSTVWDRVMFDPVTAVVVTVDRYHPTPAQRRLLEARDRHCRFPGCRTPARRCQADHNHEHHEGGPTSITNLACLCVRHHTLKTETDWTVRQLPGGTLEWSSPSGRTHTDQPARVIFTPSAEPPPF